MAIDLRLSDLLEKLHESGRTPEEVCGDFPELLPELRERWRRVRSLEAELDAIFPPEREASISASGSSLTDINLPSIQGYEVEGLIGRGGMGVVFRARHLRLNRVVAIKLAIAGAYAAPRERLRFQREAEAVAALRHPNVVQIYDVGDSEGRPFYAMEFVSGGSLAQRDLPWAPREAASLLLDLAGAVHAAHIAGIIHRDLKPANILIEEDGTPKIGDFGLSRRIDDASALTLNGAVMGTPSYMAPEQAAGDQEAMGASVDIHALGAILYELLTGRPPYLGKTPAETIRQVIHSDPMPLARLNAKIPRDLEIICLKCLSKDPARRYASAASLAGDLRRFLAGEAIEARPEVWVERMRRRIRRRPGAAAAVVGGTLLAISLIGGGWMVAAERATLRQRAEAEWAATERAAASDLEEMTTWLDRGAWDQACAALERARGRLGDRGSPGLRDALRQGRSDLDTVERLEALRGERARFPGSDSGPGWGDKAYADEFLRAGLGGIDDLPSVVAERVRASDIRWALVDALDDWPVQRIDTRRKAWLLEVARLADKEQSSWAVSARDPAVRKSREALERLSEQPVAHDARVPLLLSMAFDLKAAGGDPIPLLQRVQQAHPGDFRANLALGDALTNAERREESIRFWQAAVSIRPEAAIGFNNLGSALLNAGHPEEAIGPLLEAIKLYPNSPASHHNLARALKATGRVDESIEELRLSIRFDPKRARLYADLGDALASKSSAEAEAEYRQALSIDPKLKRAREGLRTVLIRLGRPEEALAAWRSAIKANPGSIATRDGYAEFCLSLGHDDEYREERRILLDQFEGVVEPRPAERLGRACLLLPASKGEAEKAASLIDRALAAPSSPALECTRPYYLLAKGLAEYRLGRFSSAIALMQGPAANVLGPCPLLITAMAKHRLGLASEARVTLAAALRSHNWDAARDNREAWIYVILRREAEALILGQEP